MTAIPQTEAYLIGSHNNEQAAAFTALYNTYHSALLSVLIKLVNDPEKAEDLLQDTFIKAWTHLHQYDPAQGRPYTWLLTITRHVAMDELRHRKVQAQAITYMGERMGEGVLLAIHDGLLNSSIFSLLPPKYRQIIELTYIHGWTQQEIAQELNVPLGTIKTRTRNALQELRQFFSQDICQYHSC
ncbi:RNA polymerase sigma factor [Spirosoma koreense]